LIPSRFLTGVSLRDSRGSVRFMHRSSCNGALVRGHLEAVAGTDVFGIEPFGNGVLIS